MVKKQKLNLVEELTTHKCDYKFWSPQPAVSRLDARPREKPVVKPSLPHVPIDSQSHTPYAPGAKVPFDLYIEPKPIVGTDPRKCFGSKKPHKYVRSHRNVHDFSMLSPALPLNHVEHEEDLTKLLKYTYTVMDKGSMENAALKSSKPLNPPNRVVDEGNGLSFKPNLYSTLPYGWIAAAPHWDCLQSRFLGDPHKTFWERRSSEVECGCSSNQVPNIVSQETKHQIRKLKMEDKLRLPYDITITGYGGYRQICAKGVPLDKSEIQSTNN